MNRIARFISAAASCVLLSTLPLSAQDKPMSSGDPFATAEGLVRDIYSAVSFEPANPPDWDRVRSMFLPEAVVVLRTTRDSSSIFTVDGFVNDFVTFIENSPAKDMGFTEKVVKIKPMVFKDIAAVMVLYEASIPGRGRPPQKGVDCFHLMKRNGRWWIVSVVNDVPFPGQALPSELQ